jgi:UDP-N-acetyl-D-mannosaminuronic acid dehydrogenase
MAAMEVDQNYRRFREMRSYRLVPPAINSS